MSFILKEGVVPPTFEELEDAVVDLFTMANIVPIMSLSTKIDMDNGEVIFSIVVDLVDAYNEEDLDYNISLTKKYSEDTYKRLTIEEVRRDLIAEMWAVVFTEVLRGFKLHIGGEEPVNRLSKVG